MIPTHTQGHLSLLSVKTPFGFASNTSPCFSTLSKAGEILSPRNYVRRQKHQRSQPQNHASYSLLYHKTLLFKTNAFSNALCLRCFMLVIADETHNSCGHRTNQRDCDSLPPCKLQIHKPRRTSCHNRGFPCQIRCQ